MFLLLVSIFYTDGDILKLESRVKITEDKGFLRVLFITARESGCKAVADPGFPAGGANLRCERFLAEMFAKTTESGPVGGRAPAAPLDPPM